MDDVLIAGAGPVGLTLANELCRHGAKCRIIDRLAQPSPYCRAIGMTPRTLEVWEDMGLARRMIEAGLWITGGRSIIAGRPLPDALEAYADLPYGSLGVPQYETERVLATQLQQFGVAVERGVSLTALEQDASKVSVRLAHADGREERAATRYLVGCDGAHSAVRRALGIGFEGDAFPMSFMLGDVHIDWDLPRGMTFRALMPVENDAPDLFIAIPLPEPGRYRVSAVASPALLPEGSGSGHGIQSEARGPSLGEIQAVADRLVPGQPRVTDLRWSSVFRISMRLAERYADGRVFIAGDAAHIHPPTGGQGMNTGIQDAYNLGWKLALVLQGAAPEALLESYEGERRPVGAEVVARTVAATQNYGREPGGRPDRLADTQIRISYKGTGWIRDDAGDLGENVPQAGDRAPDAQGLVQRGVGFPLRLFEILRGTEHVLLVYLPGGHEGVPEISRLAAELRIKFGHRLRVVVITAEPGAADQPWITVLHDAAGQFARAYGGNASFLVRPDGYIGWRGKDGAGAGLQEHLARLFSP